MVLIQFYIRLQNHTFTASWFYIFSKSYYTTVFGENSGCCRACPHLLKHYMHAYGCCCKLERAKKYFSASCPFCATICICFGCAGCAFQSHMRDFDVLSYLSYSRFVLWIKSTKCIVCLAATRARSEVDCFLYRDLFCFRATRQLCMLSPK